MAWYHWFSSSKGFDQVTEEEPSAPIFQRLGSLRRSDGTARKLPRFQGSASDILHGSRGHGNARVRVRDAFTPSQPVLDPRLFAGRTEVLQTLIRSIEDLRLHVVVYGERGMGKTSMLHVLSHLAREAQYHVSYHSCGERTTFEETFRAIAADIPLLYHGRYDPSAEAIEKGGSLADLLPKGEFGVNQLSEVFSHLSNTRILIILDEFDRSPSGAFRRSIAELVKSLSDRSVRVQLVIAGVAGNLAELVEHIPSIRRNIFGLRVPAMTGDEVKEMIRIGEEISGLSYAPSAVDQIILVANGSPYLASVLSQYSGFSALEHESTQVEREDVAVAARMVTDEVGQRISDRSREAIDRALADGHSDALYRLAGVATTTMGRLDEAKLEGLIPGQSFRDVADMLRSRYGLIEPIPHESEGRYRFREEGVPTFIWLMFVSRQEPVPALVG